MIIIKLTGGLGNQMFQYAFYKSLKEQGRPVLIDNVTFKKRHLHESIELKEIFPSIDFEQARMSDIKRLSDQKGDLLNKVRRNLIGKRRTHFYEDKLDFKEYLFSIQKDMYLDGYWQSEKYFSRISEKIRDVFQFASNPVGRNANCLNIMPTENSVAIHVRKAKDFQSKLRKDACDIEYYKAGIERMQGLVANPVFYIFSDNFSWCRSHLDFCSATFVDWNPTNGAGNYLDMQLMSNCKHLIIANSSYSWWAAWLNRNANKTIIAPEKWFSSDSFAVNINDIIPSNWIKI